MNELPSPALTRRFLVLCEQYGSERLAVQIVAVGRSTGVGARGAVSDWTSSPWQEAPLHVALPPTSRIMEASAWSESRPATAPRGCRQEKGRPQ